MNKVFIATSLDGFIADKDGGIDWLSSVPNPDHQDNGYTAFIQGVDAILMGRKTFETVLGFDMDWPYHLPVFVLSRTMENVPAHLQEKVFLVSGTLTEIIEQIRGLGYPHLYIDGGVTIQNFLQEDLIDEITISQLPVLLGDGFPLFGTLPKMLEFELVKTDLFLDQITQNTYVRKRANA